MEGCDCTLFLILFHWASSFIPLGFQFDVHHGLVQHRKLLGKGRADLVAFGPFRCRSPGCRLSRSRRDGEGFTAKLLEHVQFDVEDGHVHMALPAERPSGMN